MEDLLAKLAHEDAPPGQLAVSHGHAYHIAGGQWPSRIEEKIGSGEIEEMQGMRLEDLGVMKEATDLVRRRTQITRVQPMQLINGFAGRQVVAHRTDPAQSLHQYRNFPIGTTLDEALESAEFHDMKTGFLHPPVLIQMDGHPAMAFHPGHGVNGDLSSVRCHLNRI